MQSDNFRSSGQDTESLMQQGIALAREQRFAEAVPFFENAAGNLEKSHGPGSPEMAECLQSLAACYEASERYYDSMRVNWHLLRIGEGILGRNHPDIVSMLLRLAETNTVLGRYEEALQLVEQGLESAKQCLTPDHPLSVNLMEGYQYLTTVLRAQAQAQNQFQNRDQFQGGFAPPGSQPVLNELPAPFAPPGSQPVLNDVPAPFAPPGSQPVLNDPTLLQNQAQAAGQSQNEFQNIQPGFSQSPGAYMASAGALQAAPESSNMHDFAREMLKDMPPSKNMTPFSQSVNPNSNSGVSFSHIGQPYSQDLASQNEAGWNQSGSVQGSSGGFALDPSMVPLPTPPERQPGETNRASFSNALTSQRPSADELDESHYTPEAIAQLTKRDKKQASPRQARYTDDSESRIKIMRLLKEFAVPVGALVVMVAMVIYLFGGGGSSVKNQKNGTATGGAASSDGIAHGAKSGSEQNKEQNSDEITLQSADGKKTLKLLPPDQAFFMTATDATAMPFSIVGNNWTDYFVVCKSAFTEKQYWYERRPSTFRGEDGSVYYLKNSPESKVIEKMNQLAGWAQSYYLRTGEYPKLIPEGGYGDFAYLNPFTGKSYNIILRQLQTKTSDASDVRAILESGQLVGNDATNVPGDVACYAAILGDEKTSSTRCVRFFIRGCDVEGHHLASGLPGKVFVISAGNEYLSKAMVNIAKPAAKVKAVAKIKSKARGKGKNGSKDNGKDSSKDKDTEKAEERAPLSLEEALMESAKPPEKASRLLIVDNPPIALTVFHYILPIIFAVLTLVCFGRSQMQGYDIKGKETSRGSSLALNLAMGFFCMTLLMIVLQFVVLR